MEQTGLFPGGSPEGTTTYSRYPEEPGGGREERGKEETQGRPVLEKDKPRSPQKTGKIR